jgi:ferredoxin-like protein FixX
MKCPHCGCAVPLIPDEVTIEFANPFCTECGTEFVIFKNDAMTRHDYLTGKLPDEK